MAVVSQERFHCTGIYYFLQLVEIIMIMMLITLNKLSYIFDFPEDPFPDPGRFLLNQLRFLNSQMFLERTQAVYNLGTCHYMMILSW